MELDFIIDEQSLQTLCFHYIVNHKTSANTIVVNSILMKLSTMDNNNTFYDIFELCCLILDQNNSQNPIQSPPNKQYYKNLSLLLKQLLTKYPLLLSTTPQQQLIKIFKFSCAQVFCALTANDYISLLDLILTQLKKQYQSIYQILQLMILNNKMCVSSYRQITRYHLYNILKKIVKFKNTELLTNNFINKVIRAIQDQKDPRNISQVFQIYLSIITKTNQTVLIQLRKKLFDCLQMYYPIDFQGNFQKYKINLQDIASLLDQCLTHPLFATQLKQLLVIKMSSPPISKYISTFILTRNHPITSDTVLFWHNLLMRTGENDYLQQEYQQDTLYSLSDLVVELLNRIVTNNGPLPCTSYQVILNWLNKFIVDNIFNTEQNSKAAGITISTIKHILKKCNNLTKHLLTTYAIHQFLTHVKSPGDILYKLGMLVPILQCKSTHLDTQITGLLVLTLSQIYHKYQQPHPKILVLKLFISISNNQTAFKMINQTNIKNYCLQQLLSNYHDIKIINAYLDFLVQVYANDQLVQSGIFNLQKIQNKVYGIVRLANKLPNLQHQIAQLLSNNSENHQKIFTEYINILKILPPSQTLKTLNSIPETLSQSQLTHLTTIIDNKFLPIQINNQNFQQLFNNYLHNIQMLLLTKNIWRSLLISQNIRSIIKNSIQISIKSSSKNQHTAIVTSFYNKTITAFTLPENYKIKNPQIQNSSPYITQQYKMLPIEPHHHYSPSQCQSWPTIIQYAWKTSKQIRMQLIQFLPSSILTKQTHRILPIILAQKDIETISKITKNTDSDIIITHLIPFLILYLQQQTKFTQVQKIVSCNKILFDLQTRSKQQQNIHNMLVKIKNNILIMLEKNFIHPKRRARQSSRTVFALYNVFK